VGESLIPARTPKDDVEQYGEVNADALMVFSYTVEVYKCDLDVTKKRKDSDLLAGLEKVSSGATLWFYKKKGPRLSFLLSPTRLHKTLREKSRKKYPLPPTADKSSPTDDPFMPAKQEEGEEDNDEEDFFVP